MKTEDLTIENLRLLVDISISYNEFTTDYLTFDKVYNVSLEVTYLRILWYSNYELYEIDYMKEAALDFIYNKKLNEMPKYVTPDYSNTLSKTMSLIDYNWVPIVARWRLQIGL